VVIDNPGDATAKADSGKVASVLYKGYFLNDDKKVFDTNMDSTKGHAGAYPVQVGAHAVIQAWDEALPYFGKGGSGKIFAPAVLAYGGRPQPDMPAYSNLIF